jgi:hypothetical protein
VGEGSGEKTKEYNKFLDIHTHECNVFTLLLLCVIYIIVCKYHTFAVALPDMRPSYSFYMHRVSM